MFGLFNRRTKLDEEYGLRAIGVTQGYFKLRERGECAGYIFSRVLHDARSLLQDKTLSREERLAIIERNIAVATPRRGFDGGLSLAALQFLALILRSERNIGFGSLTLSSTYAEIAKFGLSYGSLNEADYLPPENARQRKILSDAGFRTMTDLVNATIRSGREVGQSDAEIKDSLANVMSLIDLRRFEENDVLWLHLQEIESATLGPIVWGGQNTDLP